MTTQRFVASLREGASAIYSAIDETILSDIRANRLRIAGLRGESQVLTVMSVFFVMTGIVLMILSPQIRRWFDLYSHTSENAVNGTLIPLPAIAIIGFAVCLAWSLVLYASTSMARWIRIVVTIIHASLMLIWLLPLTGMMNNSSLVCMIALLVVSILTLRSLSHESPWRWIGIFVAESIMMATSHWQYVDLLQQSGINMLLAGVALIMQQQSVLVVPMMFYVGINMARAAMNFGQWGTLSTAQATIWQLAISILFIGALRVLQIPSLRPPTPAEIIVAGVYIILIVCAGYVIWRIATRPLHGTIEKLLGTYAPWLVVVSMLPVLIVTLINFAIGGINMVTGASNPAIIALWDQFAANSTTMTYMVSYLITIGFAAAVWIMWRRQQLTFAIYLSVVCGVRIITHSLDYIHIPLRMNVVDTLLYAVGVTILLFRLRNPELRHTALGQIFALSIISYFMQQLDFLNNPLSPVFSYTGIFFVGFGFVWDTLVGAGWVNESSIRFPRHARLFGYLGYTLLTVTLVMWAGLSLNTDLLALLSGKNAVDGVYTYGFPAVHVLYLLIIFSPSKAFAEHSSPPA